MITQQSTQSNDSGKLAREHRQDLDGLRGIAVLGVFFYHLAPSWLPGGFVGVDVFLVLSGYLITGILLPQIYQNRFSFANFFQRRIARIFPALAMMLLTVLVFGSWFYPKEDTASIGAAGAAAAVGAANLKFMMQGSYFKITLDTQPLLHTWSLGVEEQYYLCVPILLVALHRMTSSLRVMRTVLWTLAITSYLLCVWITAYSPTIAFYFMPLRAWELLFGAILAASELGSNSNLKDRGRRGAYGLSVFGILGCMVLMSDRLAFPGWVAIVPVAFSVLAIAVGRKSSSTGVHRWISSDLMAGIGRLSYSLYLWHWPVFSIVDYSCLEWRGFDRQIIKVVLSVVLSVVSYRFLESPARLALGRKEMNWATYGIFVFVTLLVSGKGIWDWRTGYLNASVASITTGGLECRGAANGPIVVLFGDSVASSQATSVARIVNRKGGTLYVTSSAGTRPLPPSTTFENLITFLSTRQVDYIVIACAWHNFVDDADSIGDSLKRLQEKSNAQIVLVGQAPFLPEEAERDSIRRNGFRRFSETPENLALRERTEAILSGFESSRVKFVKSSEVFLEPDKTIRFVTPEGWQVYQDYLHLSSYGSQMLWDKSNSIFVSDGR